MIPQYPALSDIELLREMEFEKEKKLLTGKQVPLSAHGKRCDGRY